MDKNLKFKVLSEGLKNGISITCRKYNISRTIYYRWLGRYKSKGIDGLNDIKKQFTPTNRINPEVELLILGLIRTYPSYGPRAIKYLLEEIGYNPSESAVFNVMTRNNLTNKKTRLKYARGKESDIKPVIPPFTDLSSGECLIFWITDYGHFDHLGSLFEYTFFDYKSRVACTRLYNKVSFENFEDLLAAVAIPVAQILEFNTKYLCFFQTSKIIKRTKYSFETAVNNSIQRNGFDVKIHFLEESDDLEKINALKRQYTADCMTFLLPLISKQLPFIELKLEFQQYVRNYNIDKRPLFGEEMCSPLEYHNKLTDTKMILPLWAYIERQY